MNNSGTSLSGFFSPTSMPDFTRQVQMYDIEATNDEVRARSGFLARTKSLSISIWVRVRVYVARTRFVGKGKGDGLTGNLRRTSQKIESIPIVSLIKDRSKTGKYEL
ncbi:major facilitator superfamily MFS_1 [Striga asiatica]|uniref:Major facilitator superfamily MFS_1 n=1 Tax=Striga asiatica TaxID=4170 RepID=A0A5A7R9L7_STRAF|nr:major facilitator superfamily MFS_1 [Striga asiatica]